MQTPSSPVNLAWAEAMKAAISSCRTWMNSILPLARCSAPKHAVDAVAGIAVDPPHAPLVKALDEEIADGLGHGIAVLAVKG